MMTTIRRALPRLQTHGKRAKHWSTSPEPDSARKKKWRDRLIALAAGHADWVVGLQDEVWWSRLAQPHLHAWTDAKPRRLIQNEPDRHDPAPKAVACYGLLRTDTQGMLLRFVDGRPISAMTTPFLAVADRTLGRGRANGAAAGVGQGRVACQPGCTGVAQGAHPSRQAGRRLSHRRVSLAEQESLAEPHRAQMGAWQAGHGRTGSDSWVVDELKQRICTYDECELLEPIAQ